MEGRGKPTWMEVVWVLDRTDLGIRNWLCF